MHLTFSPAIPLSDDERVKLLEMHVREAAQEAARQKMVEDPLLDENVIYRDLLMEITERLWAAPTTIKVTPEKMKEIRPKRWFSSR